MHTTVDEIADGIYRLSTFLPQVAPPAGFTVNQFLIVADDPLLFHTGHRQLFPTVLEAASRVVAPSALRWISFGHLEADECGGLNRWLAAAPHAVAAHGALACDINLRDLSDRQPRVLADQETIDLGGKRVRYIDTPHTPHGWDAGVMFEETSGTLLCGDLFTQTGTGPALTASDIVGPAVAAEDLFKFSSLHPEMGQTIRRLAALKPTTLAVMHGSSFTGNATDALQALADAYDERTASAREALRDYAPAGN